MFTARDEQLSFRQNFAQRYNKKSTYANYWRKKQKTQIYLHM